MRRTRAERRHHHRRIKNKVKNYSIVTAWPEEYSDDRIRRFAENPKKCSCDGCRNVRSNKWLKEDDKKTICERRIEDSFKQELNEMFED